MSIVYSLISRAFEVVLCEHTEYTGNFQQISRLILRKIKKNCKYTIEYDKYKFHYVNEDDLTYLCMTEGIPDEFAFGFLFDIKRRFIQSYDYDKIAAFTSYQLNDFENVLKQLMAYYNTNPKFTKSGEIIKELSDGKNVMLENIEKLMERDEKLNIVAMKSETLNQHSKNINYLAEKIKKQAKMKQMKAFILIGGGVVIGLLLFFIMII